ncbi:MAG: hypothetical protein IJF37_08565 [Lachnospiraceae bacterium]|nr:hypothetical protein [Lachnospiraceae bacterium]
MIFADSITKVVSDSFELNTADYAKDNDGKITVEVKNIKDIVGNVGTEKSFTIYIDDKAPTAIYEGIQTSGKENITPYGNFYNAETTFIFKISDNMTGIKSATLTVGDKEITGTIADGKVSFVVPVGYSGQVSLKLVDYVDNVNYVSDETLPRLNDIANEQGIKVYTSDYILIENIVVGEPIYTVRQADKDIWYKSQVDLDIAITDESVAMVSSGLSSVMIYINDKEYQAKTYENKDTIKDTFKVSIDNQWINDVINENGSYTVKLVIIDNAGNESVYSKTVYIDTVAPVISNLTGVVDGSVNTGTVTVNVEVDEKHYREAGNKTTVTVTKTLDGQTEAYEVAEFTMDSKLTDKPYIFTEDGDYTVIVTSEDAAGNVAVGKNIAFKIDNTAPLADITGVTENAYYLDKADAAINIVESNYEDMNVVISITHELNGVVNTIDNVVFDKTQKNSTRTQTFTEEGRYTIKVNAVDAAGNVAITRTVIFTVDASAPLISISGIENGVAYKDDVIPVITINDNYYKDYSVRLVKNGVYFTEDMSGVISDADDDVTALLMKNFSDIDNGVTGTFDTFEKVQSNDGIYTLTVSATDNAGRTSSQTVQFSVNRFGSVYTFDDNLKNIIGTYNTAIDTDFKITEYNADRLVADSVNIRITRDGSPLDEVIVDKSAMGTNNATGESGWYQYEYVISQDNFKYDGVYVITVSSADEAGNNSENITYDELSIRFSVDTTKPEVVKITGLSESSYDAEKIDVSYEVFDAIGLKEVKVFLDKNCIQTVTEFADITSYAGIFTIEEGANQEVRFTVIDMAGNVVDSSNAEDIEQGKIVDFNSNVTVTTNMFVRWYANKPLFYGTIAATGSVMAGGTAVAGIKIRRKSLRVKK